jgi:hypothetical protein
MSTHKIKSFEDFLTSNVLESVKSDAEEIKQEIDFEEMEEVDPEKIAAALSKLIDANGDIDKIDIQEIEENFKQILESEEDKVNESGGTVVVVLEVIGTILGNAALIHFIAAGVSKILGRKVEDSKVKAALKKFVDMLKNVTGFAGKMIEKFLTTYYGIDILAMVLTFIGLLMIGNKNRYGFIVALLGNSIWIFLGFWVNSFGLMFANFVIIIIYLRNFTKWNITK